MMLWIRLIGIGLLAVAVAAYAGDWLVFNLRGSITSKVTVSHFLSAPLKNNKQELDYLGSEEVHVLGVAVSARRSYAVLVPAPSYQPDHEHLVSRSKDRSIISALAERRSSRSAVCGDLAHAG